MRCTTSSSYPVKRRIPGSGLQPFPNHSRPKRRELPRGRTGTSGRPALDAARKSPVLIGVDRPPGVPIRTKRRATGHDRLSERGVELLHSQRVCQAFDLSREVLPLRARYGRNRLGQSLLLARRLVEAGVRFVNVNDKIHNGQLANWDSHENNFARLKDDLLPPADQALATLIEDLDERGLLESTLVVAMAEFGRTPRSIRRPVGTTGPIALASYWPAAECRAALSMVRATASAPIPRRTPYRRGTSQLLSTGSLASIQRPRSEIGRAGPIVLPRDNGCADSLLEEHDNLSDCAAAEL